MKNAVQVSAWSVRRLFLEGLATFPRGKVSLAKESPNSALLNAGLLDRCASFSSLTLYSSLLMMLL